MIEAHYSNDMKVKRPKINPAEAPADLPRRTLFSDRTANEKLQGINTDIYSNVNKEKKSNELNKSLYFKIFGTLAVITAGIAGFDKIRKFFRKS